MWEGVGRVYLWRTDAKLENCDLVWWVLIQVCKRASWWKRDWWGGRWARDKKDPSHQWEVGEATFKAVRWCYCLWPEWSRWRWRFGGGSCGITAALVETVTVSKPLIFSALAVLRRWAATQCWKPFTCTCKYTFLYFRRATVTQEAELVFPMTERLVVLIPLHSSLKLCSWARLLTHIASWVNVWWWSEGPPGAHWQLLSVCHMELTATSVNVVSIGDTNYRLIQ